MDLLQHLVDVRRVCLLPGLGALLLLTAGSGSLLSSILFERKKPRQKNDVQDPMLMRWDSELQTNLLFGRGLAGGSLSSDSGLLLSGLGGHFGGFEVNLVKKV